MHKNTQLFILLFFSPKSLPVKNRGLIEKGMKELCKDNKETKYLGRNDKNNGKYDIHPLAVNLFQK